MSISDIHTQIRTHAHTHAHTYIHPSPRNIEFCPTLWENPAGILLKAGGKPTPGTKPCRVLGLRLRTEKT